jgi:hypothetical protein
MALIYAARFPGKVRKLALAGAPIDIAAGFRISRAARRAPSSASWSISAADASWGSTRCSYGSEFAQPGGDP